MKINVEFVEDILEEEIIIKVKNNRTELLNNIIDLVNKEKYNSEFIKDKIVTKKEGKKFVIDIKKVYKIYSIEKNNYIKVDNDEYLINIPLYKLEEILPNDFIRISNSEIANINYILNFEVSFNGTIKINFKNKDYSYVSRSYIKKFKKRLGI